jgi:hypothetical protein
MMGRRMTILAAGPLLLGCDALWRDHPDFVWHGERVSVYGYGYTEADLCGGSLAELDGHTKLIERELGIEDAQPYDYRWISRDIWEQLEDEKPCSRTIACMTGIEAVSRWLPHMHEVTHLVTRHAECPRLLNEGLAMYYDGSSPTVTGTVPWGSISIVDLMDGGLTDENHGDQWGVVLHFTSFLAETYGPSSILDLCEEVGVYEPPLLAWEQAVPRAYGVSLEQLLAEYDAYPKCNYAQMPARLWGCSGGEDYTFWVPGQEYVVETGCDDPQATNGYGKPVLTRRIYLFDDMKLRVSSNRIGVGPDAVHTIQECKPCSEDPIVYVENTDPLDPFDYDTGSFRAGLYEVTVEFNKGNNVRLSIRSEEP